MCQLHIRSILVRKAYNEFFHFLVDPGTTWIRAALRAVKLLRDQPPMPGQDGFRLDDARNFFERLLAELFTDLGKGLPLAISKLEPALDLIAQDLVFGHQILVAKLQFFVDRAADIRQQSLSVY